jgi:hypothetical protein
MPDRLLVVDDGAEHDIFELVASDASILRVRSALLLEVGEELAVRLHRGGQVTDATARVRGHVGPPDALVTELELT